MWGSGSTAQAQPVDAPAPAPARAPATLCSGAAQPSAERPPVDAVDVRQHGARGDGRSDDTAAIQRALDALAPGQWLVFPRGRYLHASRLVVSQPGSTLWGHGATLHATNPADQALLIQASGVRVLGFEMTALTDRRRHAPWESRIAIWRHGLELPALTDVQVRDNRIIESGAPGSPGANSSSSAAIFVHNVHRFVVTGNVVRRSLSDGIHITGGARHGWVAGNEVRETGDDMVAVVSYLGQGDPWWTPPASVARELPRRRAAELVRDVRIEGNDLAGPYWGRGISVVGGEDITIAANRIDASTHAAAVYVAREQGYATFGVRNVLVQGNRISRVQTTAPAYSVLAPPQRWRRTGHGAVEIVAHVFDDEASLPALREALSIHTVAVLGNRVEDSATAGLRVGAGWQRSRVQARTDETGRSLVRRYRGAAVGGITLRDNELHRVPTGLQLMNDTDPGLALDCAGNRVDGQPLAHALCRPRAGAVVATGAAVGRCGPLLKG